MEWERYLKICPEDGIFDPVREMKSSQWQWKFPGVYGIIY
jgi:hypothetical protein